MRYLSVIKTLVARYHVLLLLLLALTLRLWLWSAPLHQPANDEVEYITVARDLLAGHGWQFYESYRWLRAPLYPLFLAGSLWLAGGDLHRAALPNIALSVATVYLTYRLTIAVVGQRAAPLAALFTAILWTHATFASLYMSETLFTFLFTGSLVLLIERAKNVNNTIPRLALAGVLFGLATLTRSITLLFIPIVMIWIFLSVKRSEGRSQRAGVRGQESEGRSQRAGARSQGLTVFRPLIYCLIFLFCTSITIAPWTMRNYYAYGRPILVETGLSFNLWFFSEPHEDRNTIYRTLESISNPAERGDYATAKGLARLREDPSIVLRRLWPNWLYLWRVKPIEDRFLQESYYADVEFPLFTAALIFDDALYLVILLAAVAGLISGRSSIIQSPKWLMIAWTLYIVATVLLTHGEARYRHFLLPVLIPYAAWALTWKRARPLLPSLREHRVGEMRASASNLLNQRYLTIVGIWALFLYTILPSYPWSWAEQNVARGWYVFIGDITKATRGPDAAIGLYKRAITVQKTSDAWLRLANAARATGDHTQALDAYWEAENVNPSYIVASTWLGDMLRETGDEQQARKAFAGYYADSQQVTDWSWRELRPQPKSYLDIGDGLDFGYIGGVYPAEKFQGITARWTNGNAMLRLHPDQGSQDPLHTVLVRLRLAAGRPDGSSVQAEACIADTCHPLTVGRSWRVYEVPFTYAPNKDITVEIHSATFNAPDGRQLGVLIDRASILATSQIEQFK